MKKQDKKKYEKGNLPMGIIIMAQKVYSQPAPAQATQTGQSLEMQPGWGGKGR